MFEKTVGLQYDIDFIIRIFLIFLAGFGKDVTTNMNPCPLVQVTWTGEVCQR